jgi:hypothetical protein
VITYRDMTFCTREDCARFGVDCRRSLTDLDKARAKAMGLPVSVSYFTECFTPTDATPPTHHTAA